VRLANGRTSRSRYGGRARNYSSNHRNPTGGSESELTPRPALLTVGNRRRSNAIANPTRPRIPAPHHYCERVLGIGRRRGGGRRVQCGQCGHSIFRIPLFFLDKLGGTDQGACRSCFILWWKKLRCTGPPAQWFQPVTNERRLSVENSQRGKWGPKVRVVRNAKGAALEG